MTDANKLTEAVESVLLDRQRELYQATGVVQCAFRELESEPDDASHARYALELAVERLQAVAEGLCFIAVKRAADAKGSEEADKPE